MISTLQFFSDGNYARSKITLKRGVVATLTEKFFEKDYDLILELAGPGALRVHGAQALALSDTWTINASALVDDEFRQMLVNTASRFGHRLRVLPGAIAGLDGIAALAQAGASNLALINQRPGLGEKEGPVFTGSLRQAAALHPDEVNFAIAAALAGPGVDASTVTMVDPGQGGQHRLGFSSEGEFAQLQVDVVIHPLKPGRLHPVAASVIAALKAEQQVIWVG